MDKFMAAVTMILIQLRSIKRLNEELKEKGAERSLGTIL